MKFAAMIRKAAHDSGAAWREEFTDRTVKSEDDARSYVNEVLERFNRHKHRNEARALVRILEIEPDPMPPHVWEKSNLITLTDGKRYYDQYRCRHCEAIGRRYGLGEIVLHKMRKVSGAFVNYCTPEESDVGMKKDTERGIEMHAFDTTDWYRTAIDGQPVHVGVYQTCADPMMANAGLIVYRMFAGDSKWGDASDSVWGAIDAAHKGVSYTAPLYYRGLRHPPVMQVPGDKPKERTRVLLVEEGAQDGSDGQLSLALDSPVVGEIKTRKLNRGERLTVLFDDDE